ncbi:glycosyltransferase [Microtetraspora sp. NBRC 16547]|uniref:glycosyltransferase n=1 Tax=Microtetraspora sp. NBRC 16547 TaxID=3030993 RepID=UPI0024A4F0BB|nr:glycosyltransferase [Microtetraspora sp. NBRC 16547]GLX00103.1 hypothetical protein Misp02_41890 [Microtetraspora sp. NBRC 16547]
MSETSDLESVKRALAQAVEEAAGAAELARLLTDYQRRLDDAARSEADALTRMREAEARARTAERQNTQLGKQLAEQRYQTEVANWKLASVQESRWLKLGDALHTKNPGTVAKTLKEPVKKPPAPKRSDFGPEPSAVPETPAAVAPDPRAPQASAPMADGFEVPKGPLARPYLTVAAIVDRQTEAMLRYEWRQVTNFGPENWAAMLDQHQPHLLFVESVQPGPRQGNGGRWLEALAGETRALRDLVEACRKRGVKTVFWHSGGSVSRAVLAAEHFEYVLTTTEARVREWRAALRHDRVGVLPLAVQPRVHNPIPAVGGRTSDVFTLGAVVLPAPARPSDAAAAEPDQDQTQVPAGAAPKNGAANGAADGAPRPQGADSSHGGRGWQPLPGQDDDKTSYDDVLTAYRRAGLVVAVADVDARVVAEIAACATPVLRLAAGVKPEVTVAQAEALLSDAGGLDREAHLGWRRTVPVTSLLDPVFDVVGLPNVRNTGTVSVIAAVNGAAELEHLLDQIARQIHVPGQLVIVAEGVDAVLVEKSARQILTPLQTVAAVLQDIVVRVADVPMTRGAALDRALRLAEGDYVAVFDPRDVYGQHYLSDLVRYFGSSDAEIVGKASFYAYLPEAGATLLRQPGAEHRFLPEIGGGTLLGRRQALTDLGFADVSDEWDEVLMRQCRADGVRVYSGDRYSYICVRESAVGRLLGSARLQGYFPAEPVALI